MIRFRSPKDAIAGLMFIVLAGVLAASAGKLELGTTGRMGPGYFPLLLSGILGVLGLVILIGGLRFDGPPLPRGDWKGLALVSASVLVFGAVVQPWGFIPAVVLSSLLCIVASRPLQPLRAALFVVGLTVFCVAVFVWGLGIPVRLLG
jgi:putative tricarboxylic transport membrane protein